MKHLPKKNQEKRLQFYVNQREFEAVKTEFEASGYNSFSAYLRKKIAGNGIIIPYLKELLNKLDKLGIQQSRIGNNINQIAKKVHLFHKEGKFPKDTILQFKQVMAAYLKAISELSKAYRKLIRKFS
jgi:hypothetical protein